MLAAMAMRLVVLCCFTPVCISRILKSRLRSSGNSMGSSTKDAETNGNSTWENFASQEFVGLHLDRQPAKQESFLSQRNPEQGFALSSTTTDGTRASKMVWIPSWPRAGSTTIFSLVLAGAKRDTDADIVSLKRNRDTRPVELLQCVDFAAVGGCQWTSKWSCPGSNIAGTEGIAFDDGSSGFHCCCRKLKEAKELHLSTSLLAENVSNLTISRGKSNISTAQDESSESNGDASSLTHFGLFEPCHTGFGVRTLPDVVDEDLKDNCKRTMNRLLECNFTGMHYLWGWRRPHTDISGFADHGDMPAFTPELARSTCSKSGLVVYKTVANFGRSVSDVLSALEKHPHVYAIVPIRDPRAIYASWKELPWELEGISLLTQICQKMADSIKVHHPRLRRVVFERLIQNPLTVASGVFKFLDLPLGARQQRWLNETFNADCEDFSQYENGGRFKTCHERSEEPLMRWRDKLTEEENRTFREDANCQLVANKYGYEL